MCAPQEALALRSSASLVWNRSSRLRFAGFPNVRNEIESLGAFERCLCWVRHRNNLDNENTDNRRSLLAMYSSAGKFHAPVSEKTFLFLSQVASLVTWSQVCNSNRFATRYATPFECVLVLIVWCTMVRYAR